MGLALVVWVIIRYLSKDPVLAQRFIKGHNLWVFLLFLSLGSLSFHFRCNPSISEEIEGRTLLFNGEISDIKYMADGDRFKVKIKTIRDTCDNKITCREFYMLLKTDGFLANKGDKIEFLTKPSKIVANNGNHFSYISLHQGIYYYANARQSNIKIEGEATSFRSWLDKGCDFLVARLEKSSLERPTIDFLSSILLGDKTFLSSEARETLSGAGMAHILALSGMHVAIIYFIIIWLLFPLSLMGHPRFRRIAAILFIWAFVLLTGSSPSTVRAAIMVTLVAGAFLLERKNSAMNSLFFAVLLILIINPFSLWDIGLQLSFLCVFAIIAFANRLNPIDHKAHPMTFKIIGAVLVTLSTSIFTWMLTAYYFSRVPLIFLPANLLLLPVLPFFVGGGLLYLTLLCLGLDFHLLAKGLDFFNHYFGETVKLFSLHGEGTIMFSPGILSVCGWTVGLSLLAWALHTKPERLKKFIYAGSSLMIGSTLLILFFTSETPEESSLIFKHSLTKIEVTHKSNSSYDTLNFPRNSISQHFSTGLHILAIDAKVTEEGIEALKSSEEECRRFLIVGPRSDFSQIAEIIHCNDFSKVVLHPGIGKNKKAELFDLLDENQWDKVYSLRDNGTLELLL